MSNPWDNQDPFGGLNPALVPHPPAAMPQAPAPGDATASMSPFREALDVDQIVKNLVLDRPLSLFIPDKHLYPDWEFHIINSIPKEIAAAHNAGFREVDDPKLSALFKDLVAGHDDGGKAFRPILCARPKAVGEVVRDRNRLQLRSLYAGMDPSNKEFQSGYASSVGVKDGTFLQRQGNPWNIKLSQKR